MTAAAQPLANYVFADALIVAFENAIYFYAPKNEALEIEKHLRKLEPQDTIGARRIGTSEEIQAQGLSRISVEGYAIDLPTFCIKHGIDPEKVYRVEDKNFQQSWADFVSGPLKSFAGRAR